MSEVYVLYRGDDVVGVGTKDELVRLIGVSPSTIYWYSSSAYRRRCEGKRNMKLAQGFPKSYVIDRYSDGTKVPKTEQVRRIGNNVVPIVARRIVAANVAA